MIIPLSHELFTHIIHSDTQGYELYQTASILSICTDCRRMSDDDPTVPVVCEDCGTDTRVSLSDLRETLDRHNENQHDGDDVAQVAPRIANELANVVAEDLDVDLNSDENEDEDE